MITIDNKSKFNAKYSFSKVSHYTPISPGTSSNIDPTADPQKKYLYLILQLVSTAEKPVQSKISLTSCTTKYDPKTYEWTIDITPIKNDLNVKIDKK